MSHINGTNNDDTIVGTDGDDKINAKAGDDSVKGGSSSNGPLGLVVTDEDLSLTIVGVMTLTGEASLLKKNRIQTLPLAALIQQTTKSFAGRMSFALYRRHFEIVRAPELRDLAYLLRYQVYAHEHGFEKPGWSLS